MCVRAPVHALKRAHRHSLSCAPCIEAHAHAHGRQYDGCACALSFMQCILTVATGARNVAPRAARRNVCDWKRASLHWWTRRRSLRVDFLCSGILAQEFAIAQWTKHRKKIRGGARARACDPLHASPFSLALKTINMRWARTHARMHLGLVARQHFESPRSQIEQDVCDTSHIVSNLDD